MSNTYYEQNDDELADEESEQIKYLNLTKNEALYLSDSITLLFEHSAEPGRGSVPGRNFTPRAGIPVPLELMRKIGVAVLVSGDLGNKNKTATIEVDVDELYLLRECCRSFIKVENATYALLGPDEELLGHTLLRKIYSSMLERYLGERSFIETLTADVKM